MSIEIDTNSLPKPKPTNNKEVLEGCIPELHPQRARYDFDELSIDTLFDSANLASAVKYKDFHVS